MSRQNRRSRKSGNRPTKGTNGRGGRRPTADAPLVYVNRTRELLLDGMLILPLGLKSENPERLLTALDDEHWKRVIDNPLDGSAVKSPAQQLRDAVYQLNRAQQRASGQLYVKFRANDKGGLVSHELTAAGQRLCRRAKRRR